MLCSIGFAGSKALYQFTVDLPAVLCLKSFVVGFNYLDWTTQSGQLEHTSYLIGNAESVSFLISSVY
jgi:hypothetical protein